MTNRQVTERDLRMPEFRDANPEELEFRDDGKIVRKDRWKRGMMDIAAIMVGPRAEYEIPDIVAMVRELKKEADGRTDQEIVDQTEELCGLIGRFVGFVPGQGSLLFRYNLDDPRVGTIWQLACEIQALLTNTDVESALVGLDEEARVTA